MFADFYATTVQSKISYFTFCGMSIKSKLTHHGERAVVLPSTKGPNSLDPTSGLEEAKDTLPQMPKFLLRNFVPECPGISSRISGMENGFMDGINILK